ncbi:hypothetical protein PMAYCL1PPCAC_15973, partial [Pristionchus mayeri]
LLLCFYLALYTMTFVLIDYSFLYRMWAVASPNLIAYFENPCFIVLLLFIAASEFTIWYCNCFFLFYGTREGREDIYEVVWDKYGVDSRAHSMIMGDFIRDGEYLTRSCVAYFVYLSVMSICFGFMLIASIRIVTFLRGETSFMSVRTRRQQTKLFTLLCWQTLIPFLFLYIPCGASLTLPLLQIDGSGFADLISLLLSCFLPLYAIVVLTMMPDYRSALMSM